MCVARHAQSTQIKKFGCLCNSSKNVGDEADFLLIKKHESFLQFDSITLAVRSQPCPKCQKQKDSYVFAISQGNFKDEIAFFLPVDKNQRCLQIDIIILCLWLNMPILPKITSLLFFGISLKKVSDQVEFLHADKHESFLQIYTTVFDRDEQGFPKFLKR